MKPTKMIIVLATGVLFVMSLSFAQGLDMRPQPLPPSIPSPRSQPYSQEVTINFDTGSSLLFGADKEKLRSLAGDIAAGGGRITQAVVVAWSDQAAPKRGHRLSITEREIAANRATAIAEFLRSDMQIGNVDTYNMAESTNWVAKNLRDNNSELRSIFSEEGAFAPVTREELKMVRQDGQPKSVVVIAEKMTK